MAGHHLAGAKKKAWEQSRQIVFVDESGFYLIPCVVRTYAPRGDRPVLRGRLTRDHLSVISAVTTRGQLFTAIGEHALDSFDVVRFLEHLLECLGCPLLLIWDGSSIHKGQVQDFLQEVGAEQLLVEPLPDYAPELNPDEGVWQYLKQVELANVHCLTIRRLRWHVRRAIMRLRSSPSLVLSFFAGAELPLEC